MGIGALRCRIEEDVANAFVYESLGNDFGPSIISHKLGKRLRPHVLHCPAMLYLHPDPGPILKAINFARVSPFLAEEVN